MDRQLYSPVSSSPPENAHESRASSESRQPENNSGTDNNPAHAIPLQRSPWVLILATFYTALALSSWTILCILSFRPLTTKSYRRLPSDDWLEYNPDFALYVTNEKWYQAARVIQSIAGILTIPLTSAVCSAAAVVFIQRHGKTSNLTMRQLLALADKGWTDTSLYWQLVRGPKRWWKRYCSSFLLLAIALHILGGLISPLQALLLSSKAIKVPYRGSLAQALDVVAGSNQTSPLPGVWTLDSMATAAIPALSSAKGLTYDQLLWQSTGLNCSDGDAHCGVGLELGKLSSLSDPFLSSLPNGYHTGILRQYAPRYNFSAEVTYSQPSEFPSNCSDQLYDFHIQHTGIEWDMRVCAPVQTKEGHFHGSWENTRDRQDFTEEVFLNMSINCDEAKFHNMWTVCAGYYQKPVKSLLKITGRTTAAWFELPNDMNGGIPGPLLAKDPTNSRQDSVYQIGAVKCDIDYSQIGIKDLTMAGPLLTMAWAMFGSSQSYMATYTTVLNDPDFSNRTLEMAVLYCLQPPLWVLWESLGDQSSYQGEQGAIKKRGYSENVDDQSFLNWLAMFNTSNGKQKSRLEKALTAGLFVVNEAWIEESKATDMGGWFGVISDPGRNTNIPAISLPSLAVISVLLIIYLVSLLWVASYAAFSPRWTESMNGFTMMRIGSTIADRVPLLVTYREHEISALDELPGWIGSSALEEHGEKEAGIAKLELGSSCQVRARQAYTCYSADYEVVEQARQEKEGLKMRMEKQRAVIEAYKRRAEDSGGTTVGH